MPNLLLIVVMCVLVCVAVARADEPRTPVTPVPVDPAVQKEWLAFAWIDLRRFGEGDGQSSPRAAAGAIIEQSLLAARTAVGPLSPDDRTVISKSMEAAVKGWPAAIWLVPETPGEKAVVTARVWENGVVRAVLASRPAPNPDATPLQTAAGVLGPEGFTEWAAHRAAVSAAGRPGDGVFELAVNVDAIRHQCGGEFDPGAASPRGPAVLDAWRVGNARVLGLHARLISAAEVATRDPSLPKYPDSATPAYSGPPLLCLEASWSARSQPPGTVRTAEITSGYWPEMQMGSPVGAGEGGETAAFVLAMRATWRSALEQMLDIYGATLEGPSRSGFAGERGKWKSAHGSGLGSLIGGLEPWVAVWCPASSGRRGEMAWQVRLRSGVPGARAVKLLDELTADLDARVREGGSGCKSSAADARWAGLTLSWCVEEGAPARVRGTLRVGPPADK